MNKRVIRADGIELATQAFGDPGQPPVLLIMGAMASMLWWPDAFCERLAGQGRHVLRYDNRDTGHWTTYPPGEPPYAFDDMAKDAVRVLDGYGISSAHLVGTSMGGMIAQLVALKHPARVASLTVISSSPFGEDTSGLPGTSPASWSTLAIASGAELNWIGPTAATAREDILSAGPNSRPADASSQQGRAGDWDGHCSGLGNGGARSAHGHSRVGALCLISHSL